jgi:hypothetical protein
MLSLRNHTLSLEYLIDACGKMFVRASSLNELPNLSSSLKKGEGYSIGLPDHTSTGWE